MKCYHLLTFVLNQHFYWILMTQATPPCVWLKGGVISFIDLEIHMILTWRWWWSVGGRGAVTKCSTPILFNFFVNPASKLCYFCEDCGKLKSFTSCYQDDRESVSGWGAFRKFANQYINIAIFQQTSAKKAWPKCSYKVLTEFQLLLNKLQLQNPNENSAFWLHTISSLKLLYLWEE